MYCMFGKGTLTCHRMHVEVRGQLVRLSSFLPSRDGSWVSRLAAPDGDQTLTHGSPSGTFHTQTITTCHHKAGGWRQAEGSLQTLPAFLAFLSPQTSLTIWTQKSADVILTRKEMENSWLLPLVELRCKNRDSYFFKKKKGQV